jgi:hypothetical protein
VNPRAWYDTAREIVVVSVGACQHGMTPDEARVLVVELQRELLSLEPPTGKHTPLAIRDTDPAMPAVRAAVRLCPTCGHPRRHRVEPVCPDAFHTLGSSGNLKAVTEELRQTLAENTDPPSKK